jgi:hypothetical protein
MTDADGKPGYDTCGDHGGVKKSGGPCGRPAGWGTEHVGVGRCKLHFGNTAAEERKAQEIVARRECDMLGVPVEVDPGEALILELWEAAGNVAFYRQLVQQLPTHPIPAKRIEVIGGPEDGEVEYEPAKSGIYAPTFHVSGRATGEAKPHILVQLYNDERKHYAAIAAAALRAGVEERRLRMAEEDAGKIFGAQVKALVRMGMGDRLEEFRLAFVDALRGDEPLALGAASAS